MASCIALSVPRVFTPLLSDNDYIQTSYRRAVATRTIGKKTPLWPSQIHSESDVVWSLVFYPLSFQKPEIGQKCRHATGETQTEEITGTTLWSGRLLLPAGHKKVFATITAFLHSYELEKSQDLDLWGSVVVVAACVANRKSDTALCRRIHNTKSPDSWATPRE